MTKCLDGVYSIILYELTKLVDEYYRCPDPCIRNEIYKDILLLSEAVNQDY
ncbi:MULTISPECIES: hypothetical protein [Sutcliffiella]|uniref:hypothetical protein n=1 Tax=Sutcliffiella TaxID=2837511 RepID=UPI000A6C705F|nr:MULTISPECIES: hypothetical protein [Sutcliffiella]MED4017720.1 hypothetical protein [Sutcliffiella cohnii]WBL16756.1 hypothetical protein O1A01_09030 [Sutcliffiella sp. NC1]